VFIELLRRTQKLYVEYLLVRIPLWPESIDIWMLHVALGLAHFRLSLFARVFSVY
jgi:hypothetical protein